MPGRGFRQLQALQLGDRRTPGSSVAAIFAQPSPTGGSAPYGTDTAPDDCRDPVSPRTLAAFDSGPRIALSLVAVPSAPQPTQGLPQPILGGLAPNHPAPALRASPVTRPRNVVEIGNPLPLGESRVRAVAPDVSMRSSPAQDAPALTPTGFAPLASLSPQGEGLNSTALRPPSPSAPVRNRLERLSRSLRRLHVTTDFS